MNIPYPLVGSFTRTWVTAPISFPFWIMGLPDTSVVNGGQQNLFANIKYRHNFHLFFKFMWRMFSFNRHSVALFIRKVKKLSDNMQSISLKSMYTPFAKVSELISITVLLPETDICTRAIGVLYRSFSSFRCLVS